MIDVSRREFLKVGGLAATQLLHPRGMMSQTVAAEEGSGGRISEALLRQRISRSDLEAVMNFANWPAPQPLCLLLLTQLLS